MSEWHYVVDEQQQGPIPEAELVSLISSGQLPPDTLVWMPDMEEWAPADQLEGLVSPAAAPAVSPPPAAPSMSVLESDDPRPRRSASTEAAFLHISIPRLVIMSILTCGIYEAYWIYKNWRYLKERDDMKIRPFWRGWFAVFHCHSLFKAIHQDRELHRIEQPNFSPGALATGWIILIAAANIIGRQPDIIASFISLLMPAFVCFIPVQKYINSVNVKRNPDVAYSKWSFGQMLCLAFGLMIWGLTLLGLMVGV